VLFLDVAVFFFFCSRMSDRNAEDNEVANIAEKGKDSRRQDETKKARPRSPSQSPITVQKCESLFATPEDREKWKSTGQKWTKDVENGYFRKVEQQFEASINGYGMDNGIELDTSGGPDDETMNGASNVGEAPADRAAVAAEYWQEVSAKANLSNSRATVPPPAAPEIDHQLLARPSVYGERSPVNSPAGHMRLGDAGTQQPSMSRYEYVNE
jgi:hypothetical protein